LVKLKKMTEGDFQQFFQYSIESYAKEKTASGNWGEEEALEKSKEEFQKLLPNGKNSENNELFIIVEDGVEEKVGHIWYAAQLHNSQKEAFIYDLLVYKEHRRKGYAEKAINALEEIVKEKQIPKLSLHVFAHNKSALSLYDKIGFEPTNVIMSKQLLSAE
jgi:ribosomal protein S18 acetylase RimI-like enzyme